MSSKAAILVLVPLLWTAGCVMPGKKRTVTTPPPPTPPPTQQASTEPLSIPQTSVQLPPEQPLNPAALATAPPAPPAPEPEETSPAAKPQRRPAPAAAAKPEIPPAPATPAPAPQTAEERPRIQPILPAEEQKRILDSIAARTREINDRLRQVERRSPSKEEQNVISRIRSFLALADDAAKRNDLSQADALSDRALILTRELPVER